MVQDSTIKQQNASGPWVVRPWLDLMVGCGAWSAPLLLLVYPLRAETLSVAVAFYGLAMVFNYPHFMATVYRAYRTHEEIAKYRIFTLHVTALLALTALLTHFSFRMLPWVFTVYITWSPWHYSGQNYGLLMMFVRRNGARPSPGERNALYLAFLASYLMLFLSFHSRPSLDPLILSLGIPEGIALPARALMGLAFVGLGGYALTRMARTTGWRALLAPLTLFSTQFLWFVLPSILDYGYSVQIPQSRYSTGVLAVMHSAQYLWITSYYTRREAASEGRAWRPVAYFATLVAGGIALFVAGPWVVSSIFHYDFAVSFLIFTALVNIHHFILDGAIWKLRDGRIASLLVDRKTQLAAQKTETGGLLSRAYGWLSSVNPAARALRITAAVLLLTLGTVDLVRYSNGFRDDNLAGLLRAAALNPYDSAVEMRLARAQARAGDTDAALATLRRAVAVSPGNPAPQNALAHALVEHQLFEEAYVQYQEILQRFPASVDALNNFAQLALQLGHPDEAVESWKKSLTFDPQQATAQFGLADALDRLGQRKAALPHYEAYLKLVANRIEQRPGPAKMVFVLLRYGGDLVQNGQMAPALNAFQEAAGIAHASGERKLESAALGELAAAQERAGKSSDALRSHQRVLALDAEFADPHSLASDWFNYGQFLRRHRLKRQALVCLLKAEELFADSPAELETAKHVRQSAESELGAPAREVHRHDQKELQAVATLPESALASGR